MSAGLKARTYDSTAELVLSKFEIEDCITDSPAFKYFVVSSAKPGEALIELNLYSIQKVSTGFAFFFCLSIVLGVNFYTGIAALQKCAKSFKWTF